MSLSPPHIVKQRHKKPWSNGRCNSRLRNRATTGLDVPLSLVVVVTFAANTFTLLLRRHLLCIAFGNFVLCVFASFAALTFVPSSLRLLIVLVPLVQLLSPLCSHCILINATDVQFRNFKFDLKVLGEMVLRV